MLDLPTPKGWKVELTYSVGYIPNEQLSPIRTDYWPSPTPYRYTTEPSFKTAHQTDDWWQNEDDVLRQSQRLLGYVVYREIPGSRRLLVSDAQWRRALKNCRRAKVAIFFDRELRISDIGNYGCSNILFLVLYFSK